MAGLCLGGHNPAMSIARLPHKLRRFGALSFADKWLLLRAVSWLAVARVWLLVAPFRHVATRLSGDSEHKDVDPVLLQRIRAAVSAAGANVPWRSDCFPQAIAARALLRSYGYASTIHLGVEKPNASELAGHAWLSCGDAIVTGGEDLDRYVEVHRL